jgi:hypothetical protein
MGEEIVCLRCRYHPENPEATRCPECGGTALIFASVVARVDAVRKARLIRRLALGVVIVAPSAALAGAIAVKRDGLLMLGFLLLGAFALIPAILLAVDLACTTPLPEVARVGIRPWERLIGAMCWLAVIGTPLAMLLVMFG